MVTLKMHVQDFGDKASWRMAIWKSKKEIIGYTTNSEERGVTVSGGWNWLRLYQTVTVHYK
jgi:hypothetical protein